jgi:hypothetical protein
VLLGKGKKGMDPNEASTASLYSLATTDSMVQGHHLELTIKADS